MLPRRHTNATKAHPILPLRQHHEGVSQPLVVDLRWSPNPHKLSGGNHKVRFLSEWLLPPRSLQPPRVTRTMGKSSRLAQITNSFGAKKGKEWIYLDWRTSLKCSQITWGSRIWCRGLREREREWKVFLASSKVNGQPHPVEGRSLYIVGVEKVTVWAT